MDLQEELKLSHMQEEKLFPTFENKKLKFYKFNKIKYLTKSGHLNVEPTSMPNGDNKGPL